MSYSGLKFLQHSSPTRFIAQGQAEKAETEAANTTPNIGITAVAPTVELPAPVETAAVQAPEAPEVQPPAEVK